VDFGAVAWVFAIRHVARFSLGRSVKGFFSEHSVAFACDASRGRMRFAITGAEAPPLPEQFDHGT